uniref:SFRICE_032792 n=1 Tax=Spodoptera frugiperda TaxID=7108 RepID=A0A2H1WMT1_SPOFR
MLVVPPIPALFTKISTFPKRFMVSSIILLASSSLDTSAAIIKGSPHFFATLFNFSWFLPTNTTLAPSSANLMAVAAPIPELAPVTIATLSPKLMTSIPPKYLKVSSIILLASSSLDTSAAIIKGLPHFFETLFSFSWFLPTKTTLAPSSANLMAVAAPMPELAPVTITTLSWKLMVIEWLIFVLLPIPALFTKTSIPPKYLKVSSITLLASSSLDTSAAIIKGFPHFFETLFSFSWFLPTNTTLAPSSANLMAVAAPMPELAPVTITTLSWKHMVVSERL